MDTDQGWYWSIRLRIQFLEIGVLKKVFIDFWKLWSTFIWKVDNKFDRNRYRIKIRIRVCSTDQDPSPTQQKIIRIRSPGFNQSSNILFQLDLLVQTIIKAHDITNVLCQRNVACRQYFLSSDKRRRAKKCILMPFFSKVLFYFFSYISKLLGDFLFRRFSNEARLSQ